MENIWLVISWIVIICLVSATSFVVIYKKLNSSVIDRQSKLQSAEAELIEELKQIDLSELELTESGRRLLKMLSEETPHLTGQVNPAKQEVKPTKDKLQEKNPLSVDWGFGQKDVILEKIGDSIEIMIEGLPTAVITPDIQAKAALSLVKYGIPSAGMISAGIVGGIKTATLQLGSTLYQLKYSIKVLKVVTALDVYSEAVQWIEYQRESNKVDSKLANDALEHLRNEFKKEFDSDSRYYLVHVAPEKNSLVSGDENKRILDISVETTPKANDGKRK
jgi:hypothetical protein